MAGSGFNSSQTKVLLESAQAFASLSFIGSLFIIFCWCRYQQLRKLSFTLVLWLAVADIGADITYFMGNPGDPDPNNPTCIAQGSLQQFFQMAQILWTVAIAWVLREVTVNLRMYHEGEQKALMRRFHLFVWGFSLLSMLLPFTTNSYGSAGPWCWIEMYPTNFGTMWRYLVLYIPIWAAIIYNIRVYMRILGIVRRFSASIDGGAPEGTTAGPSSDQQMRMAKFMQRLMWYPAVLIISWTFATINRIYNTFHPSDSIFGLFFMHQMMVNLQGLLNAIVYGSTDAIRSSVLKDRCLDCRRGTSDGNDGLDPEDDYNGGTGVGMRNMSSDRFEGNFGAKVSGSSQSTSGVSNSLEDVEVYNADDYTVAV